MNFLPKIPFDARKAGNFLKSRQGQMVLFISAILFFGVLVGAYYSHHSPQTANSTPPKQNEKKNPSDETASQPVTGKFDIPRFLGGTGNQTEEKKPTAVSTNAPPQLPVSLYNAEVTNEKALSENYAPYGRLIPCETVITIDSAKIETPIIGFVTEDVYHEGRLILPAGAEVHGKAQTDRSRERLASDNQWFIVWRTSDRLNGAELPLKGIALDMEKDVATGQWALTDGSAGLRGDIIKTDNMAEIKLFAATFLSAAASGLQDTQQSTNLLTGNTTQSVTDSPKNAALQATSAVINEYAKQISDSIKKDGFYVRVPAGKQFYLYVMQTIDQDDARKGQSLVKDLKANSKNK